MHTKIFDKFIVIAFTMSLLVSYIANEVYFVPHVLIIIPSFYYLSKKEIKFSVGNYLLLAFLLWSVVTILVSPYSHNIFKEILQLKYMALGLIGIAAYQNAFKRDLISLRLIKILLVLFLVFLMLGNISGIIALFTGFNPLRFKGASDYNRATGMFGMAITYGNAISYLCAMFVAGFFKWSDIKKIVPWWLYLLSFCSSLAGMYFSYTRGGLVAFFAAVAFLLFVKSKKLFVISSIVVFALAAGIYVKTNSNSRLFQPLNSESNMIRVSLYKAAWNGFLERPVFGLGYKKFEPQSTRLKADYDLDFKKFGGHAHNNYLEMLSGTGAIGLILFVLFQIFWLLETLKRDGFIGIFLPSFIVSFMVSGLFQNTITDSENIFTAMFLYSLSYVTAGVLSDTRKDQTIS
jgi:O-antigen ligase